MMVRASIRRARRSLALVACIAAAAMVMTAVAAQPATAAATGAPAPYLGKKVPGAHAPKAKNPATPASSTSEKPAKSSMPSAATFKVDVPTSAGSPSMKTKAVGGGTGSSVFGSWHQLGSTGIAVAAAAPTPPVSGKQSKAAPVVAPVDSASVSILSPTAAHKAGLNGLVLKVARSDGTKGSAPLAVRIPATILAGQYGADFAARIRWVQIPADAPAADSQASAQPVATVTDTAAKSVVVSPQISSAAVLLTAMATPISAAGTGNFTATSLSPSGSWQVSAQTGDFAWSYPLRIPPAAAGPAPSVSLNYDSQSIDGETGSTNNQPSTIGEGWSLAGSGFIERSYVPCSQDSGASGPVTTSGDLCWKSDNATISFAGHSGQLVKDTTTGVWKLQSDDGSRFQHIVGTGCAANGTYDTDCWRLTTTDGTQYYFGLNHLPGWATGKAVTNSTWTVPVFGNDVGEPCHASTFATSACTQAWRWNLDYVVDVHGNAEALYYDAEANKYAKAGTTATSYIRGGQLDHIDYGLTASNAYTANAASDKILFGYDAYGRCSDATHANCSAETITAAAVAPAHPTSYPDVPFDQYCTAATCVGLLSPTFWSTAMLSTVTTQVWTGSAYAKVDTWSLGHSFPTPGDGTNAALWLTRVTHTGYSGTASLAEPATTFAGAPMQNRVWVVDGLAPLDKYRITSIHDSLGAVLSVNYSSQQCTPANAAAIEASPETNTSRCFPQWWSPQITPPQPQQKDLFHKYVVTSVISNPVTGGGYDQSQETDYVYTGTPAWRYDTSPLIPVANRTWSQFAGYNKVEIRVGNHTTPATQQATDYTFYQGMDGDRATATGGTKTVYVTGSSTLKDSPWLAGRTREAKTLNGVGGAALSDTVTTPWASAVTANDGTSTARIVGDAETIRTEPVSTGGSRSTDITTTYDPSYGIPLTVNTATSDAGSTCATTTYAPANTTAWILGLPKEVDTVGVACANLDTATYPAAAISHTRTTYDGLAWGATPTKGDATSSQVVDSYTGSTAATAHWVTSSQSTYDTMGRALKVTDVLGHTTTTVYSPAAGAAHNGPLTGQTVTNTAPFSWTNSTVYNPAWGVETSATDQNGKITTASYDALGRRVGVWLPGRPQAGNATEPSLGYAYTLSTTAANAVATTVLTPFSTKRTFALYDGLGRPVQTQAPSEASGTTITDTFYDAAGRVSGGNNAYWTMSVNPSATLFVPASQQQISSATTTVYDGAGRTTATIVNSAGVERFRTTTAYPGADRVDVTPPAGGTPTSTYTNSLGEKTKLVQYLAATPLATATQEVTSYGYNPQKSMTAMTDAAGNAWSWAFDVLGHQVKAVDPDTGTTTSTYDDAGNLLTSTDARGITLAYSYDNLGRKTGQYKTAVGSTGSLLASWTYDTLSKGQLTSSSSYVGSTAGVPGAAYTQAVTGYDDGYRPLGTTISIPAAAPAFGGTSYTTALAYYPDGSLGMQTDPAEGGLALERIRPSYTANGSFATLNGASAIVDGTVYTGINQLGELERDSTTGDYSTFGYDAATGAVSAIKDTSLTGSTYTIRANRAYTRNNAGNITSISTSAASVATDTQCFSYDYLQDLTSAWTPSSNACASAPTSSTLGGPAPYWASYTIDAATGNRTATTTNATTTSGTATTATSTYPAATAARPHAVQSVAHTGGSTTTDSYSYDAAGNTITRPGQTLTYDATGKLATVTKGSVVQSSVYDASGALLLQSDATNGTTLFLGDTELHLAHGATTASAVRTYTMNGIPVAERTTKVGVTGSTLLWLGADANHNTDLEVNSTTGAVTRRYADPFGNTRGTSTVWSSAHGFLNAPVSTLSALTQLGARAYDPALGRFLSVDSVLAPGNPQQNNGYSYAANSPVTLSDPSGDCFVASTDALTHSANCAGGHGSNKAAVAGHTTYEGGNNVPAAAGSSQSASSGRPGKQEMLYGPGALGTGSSGSAIWPNGKQAALHGDLNPPTPYDVALAQRDGAYFALGLLAVAEFGLGLCAMASEGLAEPCSQGAEATDESFAARAESLTSELGASLARSDLTESQLSNFNRYANKLPSAAGDPVITRGANGAVKFSTDVPGRVPGSYANYTKLVDSGGVTTNYYKTTVAPDGSIVHVKVKFP